MATSRRLDPTTRRFALEAMIGLLVVLVLAGLMVHGLVRRFGLMEEIPKPESVEMASILRRQPPRPPSLSETAAAAAVGSPGSAISGTPVARGGADRVSPSPMASATGTPPETLSSTTNRGSTAPSESASEVGTTPAPRSPAGTLAGVARGGQVETPAPVPQPYRGTEALPASRALPSPFADLMAIPKVDPRWKIRADDSSWSYCARVYDDPQRFRELEAWLESQGKRFASYRPGEVLEPPALAMLEQLAQRGGPSQAGAGNETDGVYVTSGSESLFDVAARVLGQAGRYVELAELDRDASAPPRDPLEPLPAGTRLALPIRR